MITTAPVQGAPGRESFNMATILNKSSYSLSVLARGYSAFIPPGGSKDVPDDVARAWSKKDTPAVFIAKRMVLVSGLETPTPAVAEPKADWRSVVGMVAEETSLDVLMELHATDNRPSVLKAVDERMAELRA